MKSLGLKNMWMKYCRNKFKGVEMSNRNKRGVKMEMEIIMYRRQIKSFKKYRIQKLRKSNIDPNKISVTLLWPITPKTSSLSLLLTPSQSCQGQTP